MHHSGVEAGVDIPDHTKGHRRDVAIVLISASLGLLLAPRAEAQGIEPGDRVVLASIDDVLKIEARIVASGAIHRVYTVGKVNGPWLWLEAEDLAGWIKGDRVLPFDQALEAASDRIDAGNPSANDYLTRGLLWADRGRPDLAEADFDEAIRLEPEWRTPWLNRGNLRRAAGRLQEALDDLNQAAQLAPLDPLPYYNRGLVWLDLNEPKRAYDEFGLALRVDPNHAAARFNRAALAVGLGLDGGAADAEAYLVLVGWYEELSPYAALLAAIEHRRAGRSAQADGLLAAAAEDRDLSVWPGPILDHLLGDLPLDDLLAAAETPDQQAEARAYAGVTLQIDGQTDEALPLLQWVVDAADPARIPHLLAQSALAPPAELEPEAQPAPIEAPGAVPSP
ncbi:tetratricopeptide repeat protein [Tautonia marina]|uniref:tetratricopeptide repeat protein n=1 Tax=Tautonia marina TaxID=2653855 RepID=UPI0013757BE7|nr:tetratricopeptide repeat protein [Tautonia marina]